MLLLPIELIPLILERISLSSDMDICLNVKVVFLPTILGKC